MVCYLGEEEYCINGRCECLQGTDGCVKYPISCASSNPDSGGDDSCSENLPNSVCDKAKNW